MANSEINPKRVDETPLGAELKQILQDLMKEQAESSVGSWFQTLFAVGSSLGAFFAGFTLSIVASTANSDAAEDSDAASTAKAARDVKAGRFAAISSLLFVITVLICSACGLAFAFNKKKIDDAMEAKKRRIKAGKRKILSKSTAIQLLISILSLAIQILVLTAVLYFFKVMKVYSGDIGQAGVVVTYVSMSLAIAVWLWQIWLGYLEIRRQQPEAQLET